MSMKKKSVSVLILVFMLVFATFGTQVCATEIIPRWDTISECSIDLEINGNIGIIDCAIYLNSANYYIDADFYLQKKEGTRWTNIDSWEVPDAEECIFSKTIVLSSGYDYRVKAIVTIKDFNDKQVEKITKYSKAKHVS